MGESIQLEKLNRKGWGEDASNSPTNQTNQISQKFWKIIFFWLFAQNNSNNQLNAIYNYYIIRNQFLVQKGDLGGDVHTA